MKSGKMMYTFLPGKHPHVENALVNHLVLKGVGWCRCLIKKRVHITKLTDDEQIKSYMLPYVCLKLYLARRE